jgi:hypothetical protein
LKAVVAVAAAMFSLLVPRMPSATWVDGNALLEMCQRPDLSLCHGYLLGMMDANEFSRKAGQIALGCPPAGATASQVKDIVVRYLLTKPGERHYNAASIAVIAPHEVWPCPKK